MKLKKQSTIAVALFTCALPTVTWADAVSVQYWVDIHTSSMSIPGMDSGMAGLMGDMMGGGLEAIMLLATLITTASLQEGQVNGWIMRYASAKFLRAQKARMLCLQACLWEHPFS